MRILSWATFPFSFKKDDLVYGAGLDLPDDLPSPALLQIKQLVAEHDIGVIFDPGGVEFSHPTFGSLRVQGQDDIEDLAALEAWIKRSGIEDAP